MASSADPRLTPRGRSKVSPQSRGNEEELKRLLGRSMSAGGQPAAGAPHDRNVRVASPRPAPGAEAAAAPRGEPELPFEGWPSPAGAAPAPGEHLLDAWHATYSTALAISQLRKRSDPAKIAMEAVLADDDRQQVTATTEFPWRCICYLVITAQDGSHWVGSGWFADARTVVTAGHCVFLHGAGGWARQLEVYPGRSGAAMPFGPVVSGDLHSVSRWTQEQDADFDYGAVRLAGAVPVGSLGYAARADAELQNVSANVYGYPADKPPGTLWGSFRQLSQVRQRTLVYNVSTYGGQSGCPVFLKQGEDRTVVGIHNYGDLSGNSATRITDDVYDDIQAWMASSP